MLSGKSGAFNFLIKRMFEMDLIDHAYILCGSTEIKLKEQTIDDVEEYHSGKSYKDNITVAFRQDFDRLAMITSRTLIVVDESHLDAKRDQMLDKFLKRHNLDMSGSSDFMEQNNIYILSVDATPFAEEADIFYRKANKIEHHLKGRVFMEPGEGYYGVKNYLQDRLVKETLDLKTAGGRREFNLLLTELKIQERKKFIFIRAKKNSKIWYEMEKLIKLCGIPIVFYDSSKTGAKTQFALTRDEAAEYQQKYGITIPNLEDEPTRTTVVVVKERLRCGKRICKHHIGFVWETSWDPKTDTICQSLLGRMCGYDVGPDRPSIYLPKRLTQKIGGNKVVPNLSELDRYNESCKKDATVLPQRATNVISGSIQTIATRNGRVVTQCPPIRMLLPNVGEFLRYPESERKRRCLLTLKENSEQLVNMNSNLTEAQKSEILQWLSVATSQSCHIRNYSGTSNQSMHRCHVNALKYNCASREGISDSSFLTFCITYPGFTPLPDIEAIPGEVFVIIYTDAKGKDKCIDLESRIPKENGTTGFSLRMMEPIVEAPMVSAFGFSRAILTDTDAFDAQLREFISNQQRAHRNGTGIYSRRLETNPTAGPTVLSRDVYGDKRQILDVIIQAIEQDLNVKIQYGTSRILHADNLHVPRDHTLHWIEWTDQNE
jgi:hypothetical protein